MLDEEWNRAGEENDLSVIEPSEPSDRDVEEDNSRPLSHRGSLNPLEESYDGAANKASSGDGDGNNREDDNKKNDSRLTFGSRSTQGDIGRPLTPGVAVRRAKDTSRQPGSYNPRGGRDSKSDENLDTEARQHLSYIGTPPQFYGRSVSSSMRLDPLEPGSRPLPTIPRESDSSSSNPNHPHPVYRMSDGTMRAPSRVMAIGETAVISSLKAKKGDGLSASSLIHAISSTWKRRSTQVSAGSNGTDSKDRAGSVP